MITLQAPLYCVLRGSTRHLFLANHNLHDFPIKETMYLLPISGVTCELYPQIQSVVDCFIYTQYIFFLHNL